MSVSGCMVVPRLSLVYGFKIDEALSRRRTDLDVFVISPASGWFGSGSIRCHWRAKRYWGLAPWYRIS